MLAPGFWDDQRTARRLAREAEGLREELTLWQELTTSARDLGELFELASSESDAALLDEVAARTDLSDEEAAGAFLELLITWLVTHILKLDRRVARALVARAATPADEDVSAEQVLVAALMETEKRFRMLSDEAPSLIWISGASGRRDFANKPWFDLVGAEVGPASATDWSRFVHPDDRRDFDAAIRILQPLGLKVGDTVVAGDNVDILVPNSEFMNGKVMNWTLQDTLRRVHVPFGVAYDTDKELVRTAALAAPFKPKDAALFSIISGFDAAYSAYNGYQQAIERYWTLRWLEQEGIRVATAEVVRDNLLRFERAPLYVRLPGMPSLPPGERVQLTVESIDLLEAEVRCSLVSAPADEKTP